jgi:hypothetical protein
MSNWRKWLRMPASASPLTTTGPQPERVSPPPRGRYQPLQTYLVDRYATMVVLTMSQIEDILGFALPEESQADGAWWTGDATTGAGTYAEAWRAAGRTAVPNLVTRTVAFERTLRGPGFVDR